MTASPRGRPSPVEHPVVSQVDMRYLLLVLIDRWCWRSPMANRLHRLHGGPAYGGTAANGETKAEGKHLRSRLFRPTVLLLPVRVPVVSVAGLSIAYAPGAVDV